MRPYLNWIAVAVVIGLVVFGVYVIASGRANECKRGGDTPRGYCLPPAGSYKK